MTYKVCVLSHQSKCSLCCKSHDLFTLSVFAPEVEAVDCWLFFLATISARPGGSLIGVTGLRMKPRLGEESTPKCLKKECNDFTFCSLKIIKESHLATHVYDIGPTQLIALSTVCAKLANCCLIFECKNSTRPNFRSCILIS